MELQGHERCVSSSVFSHLEMDELEEVFQRINHQSMKKGEYLFMAGDRSLHYLSYIKVK